MSKRVSRTSQSSAAAEFVLTRSGTLSRTRSAILGTALGCSIAVFSLGAPGTAWATNECGPLVASGGVDQVTCTPGTYPSGITYNDNSGNPVVVTLGSGVDPGSAGGVFLENQAPGAYAGIIIDAGASVNVFATAGAAAYTSGGCTAFVTNFGFVAGDADALYADAINGGNVYVTNDGNILSPGNMINAKSSDGDVEVFTVNLGESTTAAGTTAGVRLYAADGTGDTVVDGNVSITSQGGYAVGVNSAATFENSTRVYGSVYLQGYSGAMGVKTSSANQAYTTVYGNVVVTSGYGGKGGGNATGVITVGSDTASTTVYGSVTVTAVNGVAVGVESSSFNGSYVDIGSVKVTGDLGATAIYAKTIYDHNTGVFVEGDVKPIPVMEPQRASSPTRAM